MQSKGRPRTTSPAGDPEVVLAPSEPRAKKRVVVLGSGWGARYFIENIDRDQYEVLMRAPTHPPTHHPPTRPPAHPPTRPPAHPGRAQQARTRPPSARPPRYVLPRIPSSRRPSPPKPFTAARFSHPDAFVPQSSPSRPRTWYRLLRKRTTNLFDLVHKIFHR
jgi:hypothetical protein